MIGNLRSRLFFKVVRWLLCFRSLWDRYDFGPYLFCTKSCVPHLNTFSTAALDIQIFYAIQQFDITVLHKKHTFRTSVSVSSFVCCISSDVCSRQLQSLYILQNCVQCCIKRSTDLLALICNALFYHDLVLLFEHFSIFWCTHH